MLIVAVLAVGTLWARNEFWPFGPSSLRRPALAETPPLKPYTRTSITTLPVVIDLAAIRTTLDAAMPRSISGKRDNPMTSPFGKTDIGWNIGRGSVALAGLPDELTLSATLSGTLRITNRSDAHRAGADSWTGSIGSGNERGIGDVMSIIDQHGNIRGHAKLTVHPTLLQDWRIDPKLAGKITIADGGLTIAGLTIDVSENVKSAIDSTVSEELGAMRTQLRNDSMIEQAARREWIKMCRSVSLAAVAADTPNLWLELRPIRAFASQPRIDRSAVTVTVGVEAETRIVPTETKPICPFPAQLDIIPPVEQGSFAVIAPIEVPFTEINQLIDRQLSGRTFPETADAPGIIKVLRAQVIPSGNRLLISLLVKAREQKTWFGFDASATVYISVRPELDLEQQVLRLKDMVLDVESRAAFGLFGAAARAAIPYFEEAVEQNAVIDLKPYVLSARRGIEAVIADYDKHDDSLTTDAAVTALRLIGVEFDSKTLRVIAEVEGRAKIAVSKLPAQ